MGASPNDRTRGASGPRRRLATRIAAVTSAVFVLFVGGATFLSLRQFRALHERTLGERQERLVAAAAAEVEVKLGLAHLGLERNAALIPPAAASDPAEARRFLASRAALPALFPDGIVVVGLGGAPVATLPGDLAGPAPGSSDGLFPQGPPGEVPAIAGPYASPRRGGAPAVLMTAPIRDARGAVAGWLRGGLLLLEDSFLGRQLAAPPGPGGWFALVTAHGVIAPPGAEVPEPAPAGEEPGRPRLATARSGAELIAASRRIAGTDWSLVAVAPAAEAQAPFDRTRGWLLLATAAGAVLLLAAVWLTTRQLTWPLAAMTRQVEALAAGRTDVGPLRTGSGDEVGTLAAAFDRLLAERDGAQEALRRSEERFRLAFKTSPEPMTLARLDDGALVAVNEGFLALVGAREEDVLGRSTGDLGLWVDPADRAKIAEEVGRTGRVSRRDVRVRGPGGIRTVSFSASEVDIGGVRHLFALARDVTAEREAEAERARLAAELHESEARHRFAVRSVPVVQWAIDREGRFTLSEGKGLAALGLRPGQVVGLQVEELYRDNPGVLACYRRALAGESFVEMNELAGVAFESHWAPLRDDAGAVVGVTGIGLDVTTRRRAEASRREAETRLAMLERLAAVGRLAAGVAHEINNPLTYVLGSLDAAAERLSAPGADAELRELVDEARGGAGRVRAIVGDLRAFGRVREESRGSCAAGPAAESALAMMRNQIRHRARLEADIDPGPRVPIAEGRLAQVLVNLLANACQAIPEGRAAENLIRLSVRVAGDAVEIEVSDSGAGMTPEVQARLFEPFFTTRAGGEGIGLGLALSHAMIAEAGGTIAVESAPGRGTTFRIRLPRAPEVAPPPPPRRPLAGTTPAGRLSVLVIDDEPQVGRAVARLLEGHAVTVVTGAGEALERIRAGQPFDALVCDLMMPDLTGMDLWAALRAEAPALAGRMVFLTGGAFTDRARDFVAAGGVRVLEKPVDPEVLRAQVAEVALPPAPAPR